ncbi:putative Chaperone J-domain superfamily [Helianthus anomalus]
MEKVSRPANRSLRYSLTHRSFENLNKASSSSVRNSDNDDVDFDDVFGGPPTRTRYSFGSGRVKSEEESSSSPVFGESYSSPRTRTSDDFYDDIFRRSDESVREPFATSVPSDFSLPPKMTEDAGVPVFGSNVHSPSTTLSRFSSTATQKFRNNSGQSPGRTLLSREASGAKEALHSTRSTGSEVDDTSKAKTTGTKSPSNEFHFSIHKWPSVGVPLLMSLRGGNRPILKGSSKVSALSMDNMQESGFPNEDLSAKKEDVKVTEKETLAVKQEENVQEVVAQSSLLHDELERKGYEDAGKEGETKEKMQTTSGKKKPDAKKTSSSKKAESNKPGAGSPKNRVKGMVKDFFKMSNQESPPKTKTNVSSRWKTGGKKNTTQEEVNDITSNTDTNVKTKTDASKTTKLASELPAENVNIAPDSSSTIPLDGKTPAGNVKKAPDASNTIPLNGKMPAENENKTPDASFMAKEETGRSNKQKFAQNRPIRKLEDINFQQDTTPSSESVPNGSKTSAVNIDDPTLDNFQVQELTTVDDKTSKTQEESEAILALDSKIHTWSSGRKGNIRSLLSTLQLVLWAESGWKPVALVDIIEANAVKKAYNRAMLCLHPDKLQQKGADSNKKYIAEKVFDILQEAWDHFNTLGTLL